MKGIALIGFGYWGKNLMRNISHLGFWDSVYLLEEDELKLSECKKNYPTVILCNSIDEILKINEVEAIVIATPPHTHYDFCKEALELKKHVLCEKPFSTSYSKAKELQLLATKQSCVLMVDYTFLYTGAVEKIKEISDEGKLGNLLYIDSTRINLGIFQSKVNVIWDLACHDLSIIYHIIQKQAISVQATGIAHTSNGLENIAYLTIHYENNLIVHLNCSWTSPVKIRKMLIGGDKKMVVYNDIEPTDKVKIYDAGFEVKSEDDKNKLLIDYRMGDVYSPKLDNTEALSKMLSDFNSAIENGHKTKANTELALNVLQVLEAAQMSINDKGKLIFLNEQFSTE